MAALAINSFICLENSTCVPLKGYRFSLLKQVEVDGAKSTLLGVSFIPFISTVILWPIFWLKPLTSKENVRIVSAEAYSSQVLKYRVVTVAIAVGVLGDTEYVIFRSSCDSNRVWSAIYLCT
jgi:hypothetical protein